VRVRLVCFDEERKWILGKFAARMKDCLDQLSIESDIGNFADSSAQVNHYVNYAGFDGTPRAIESLMITHIDNLEKLDLIKRQMKTASVGICMSAETSRNLALMGVDKEKLCYVNPAHDGTIPLRKIVLGISCRVQDDRRKREYFFDSLGKVLDPVFFRFRIMGDSWEPQVAGLRKRGFEVDYFPQFDYSEYIKFIPSLDYYLYMGMDEGQMGFIDALAAGIKTIVTRQGYHLDAPNGITHPFTEYNELEAILLNIQDEKRRLVEAVSTWNWMDYTKKHVEIWKFLQDEKNSQSRFTDGLNSLLASRRSSATVDAEFIQGRMRDLRNATYAHYFFVKQKKYMTIYAEQGLKGVCAALVKRLRKLSGPNQGRRNGN
jgi:hypothetical protein